MTQKRLTFDHILTPAGTLSRQSILLDEQGRITAIEDAGDRASDGVFAIPGMPNAHSHCFQRVLRGLGEYRGASDDSFWSWRELMYRLASSISPDDLYVVASQAYSEMLASGFTSVAEFHYLHHGVDGLQSTDMADAVINAARDVGIRIRLLPVLYQRGGFDQAPLAEQSRFVFEEIDDYCRLLANLSDVPLGFAPHSLRAVPVETLAASIDAVDDALGSDYPVHIHISEQEREVEECAKQYGVPPLELLDRHVALGPRWNLVHGTHFSASERSRVVERGCQIVLCPSTEAYLGDGIFDAVDYVGAGGRWAIGSDSNARIDPVEELRLLEYGQRLRDQRRARLATKRSFGEHLWRQACEGGAAALMMDVGAIEVGQFADLLLIDDTGALAGAAPQSMLDALLVGGSGGSIERVFVGGDEKTPVDEPRYAETVRQLMLQS